LIAQEDLIDEAERRCLSQEAQRLRVEIENDEFAHRLAARGSQVIGLISSQALDAKRNKLAGIRERLDEIARAQNSQREAAKREAEAAEAKRQKEIVDARRAALVARMAFDRAQAVRLQTSLGENVDAYAKAIEACDEARRAFDRAEQDLAQLEG